MDGETTEQRKARLAALRQKGSTGPAATPSVDLTGTSNSSSALGEKRKIIVDSSSYITSQQHEDRVFDGEDEILEVDDMAEEVDK